MKKYRLYQQYWHHYPLLLLTSFIHCYRKFNTLHNQIFPIFFLRKVMRNVMLNIQYILYYLIRRLILILIISISFYSVLVKAQSYPSLEQFYEKKVARAMVLANSDIFTVGLFQFNPNSIFGTDNNILGDINSLKQRETLRSLSIPFNYTLKKTDTTQHQLLSGLSALIIKEDNEESDPNAFINSQESHYKAMVGYRYKRELKDNWLFSGGVRFHLLYYESNVTINDPEVRAFFDFVFGDTFPSTSFWSLLAEPELSITFRQPYQWGGYNLITQWQYFLDHSWGDANFGDAGNPEGWYFTNGIELYWIPSRNFLTKKHKFFTQLNRIDLGSRAQIAMDTSHYYEWAVGWLVDKPFKTDWIDNLGLGLNINSHSHYRGASFVLYFNY
ncbi:hypothetical protein CTM89_02240 [Photobacterium leiognathi]|uniref:Solitary outer membrane autotransporter-like beta-barrel domain-containing protein n=2 Tax=Photobacterium leiognathi TaxID=553611 RepID=A0A2T3MGF8_PHOLE|nr:hypothetical protein CTM89_02240 [Photobacterium leiognathi]